MAEVDARNIALIAAEGTPHARKQCCLIRVCQCIAGGLFNIVFLVTLMVLAPILFVITFILTLPALLEWLVCRCGREYLDSISAVQLNHCEGAAIHGVFIFEERVDADAIFKHYTEVFLSNSSNPCFYRFKQRVFSRRWLWPYWQNIHDGTLDLEYHFQSSKLQMDKAKLQTAVGELGGVVLDFNKPPWQVHVFENFTDEFGRKVSAVIIKVHHCILDGFTGLRVFMQAADPKAPPQEPERTRSRNRARGPKCLNLLPLLLKSLKKLVLSLPDKASPFKASQRIAPEGPRVCAWKTIQTVTVEDLKIFGKSERGGGATVNDVLLAALGGAFRRYVAHLGARQQDLPREIQACMWVSMSPLNHIYKSFEEVPLRWGNSTLGAVYVKLPLTMPASARLEDTPEAVRDMRERTGAPELALESVIAMRILGWFGILPKLFIRPIWNILSNKISCSTSNVPGPPFHMKWCGSPVQSVLFFVPPQGTVSVFVTIMTYNGTISVGLSSDPAVMKADELEQISGKFFEEELTEILGPKNSRESITQ